MNTEKEKCYICRVKNKGEHPFVPVKVEAGDKILDAAVCPTCWKQLWNTMLTKDKAKIS